MIYPSNQDSERILGYLITRLIDAGFLKKRFQKLSDDELHDILINNRKLLDGAHEDLTEWVEEIQQYFTDEPSNNVSN